MFTVGHLVVIDLLRTKVRQHRMIYRGNVLRKSRCCLHVLMTDERANGRTDRRTASMRKAIASVGLKLHLIILVCWLSNDVVRETCVRSQVCE